MYSIRLSLLSMLLLCGFALGLKETNQVEVEEVIRADNKHVDFSSDPPVVVAQVTDDKGEVHEFRCPPFNINAIAEPVEVKEFSVEIIDKVMGAAKEIIDSSMIKQSNKVVFWSQLVKIALRFLNMSKDFNKKSNLLKLKYNEEQDRAFLESSTKILPELMDRAKAIKVEKGAKDIYKDPTEKKRVGRRMLLIFDGIRQLVVNSPVGVHLDYRMMTIDGEYFVGEGVEAIKFMQQSGLGYILDKVSSQCDKIVEDTREMDRKFEEERQKLSQKQ